MIKRIYMLAIITALTAIESYKILTFMYGIWQDENVKQFVRELESQYKEASNLSNGID